MIFQFLAFPAFMFNIFPLGIILSFNLFVFSLLLSSLFIMTWVGEYLSLASAIILSFMLAHSGSEGIGAMWVNEIKVSSGFPFGLHILILITLFAGFWTGCVSLPTNRFSIWMRYITRYTWGVSVTKVFTSLHIEGPALFKVYLEFNDGRTKEVFKATADYGFPGKWRNFKPTFVESIATKLTEVCMELDAYGQVNTEAREQFVFKFCEFLKKTEGAVNLTAIRFDCIQLIAPSTFNGADTWFKREKWESAFRVVFEKEKVSQIKILKKPILKGPTGRELNRASFSFSENIKKSSY